jgi:hypothetical protein
MGKECESSKHNRGKTMFFQVIFGLSADGRAIKAQRIKGQYVG